MQRSMGRIDVTFYTWYHLYIALDTIGIIIETSQSIKQSWTLIKKGFSTLSTKENHAV